MEALKYILIAASCILCIAMVVLTLSLNTKSDGLGAAITGATDSYRGAMGVEEQKRNLLRTIGYAFLGCSFLYAFLSGMGTF